MSQFKSKIHICIFTQSPLTKAPRVVKEANIYAKAGYKVTLFGLWYDPNILDSDRGLIVPNIAYKAGIDLQKWNSFTSQKIRLNRRIGRELVKLMHIETIGSLGYDFKSYLKKLENEKADLYIGHEEMSMALAKELILKGHKVAFDFEDWHSKDLLPKDRTYRPVKLLESLENFILNKAIYTYTTSEAMADAMASYYKVPKPEYIYNSFPVAERENMDGQLKDIKDSSLPSLYWFSQVIGPGRGLEVLFESLKYNKVPFQLHLRGNITPEYKAKLEALTPTHINLVIHKSVPHSELISRIAEHDLALAIEELTPKSRNYTITNKMFHYLQSGIPILATETAGQLEIAKKASEAIMIVPRDAKKIACAIDNLLQDPVILRRRQLASWESGKIHFSYEAMETKLSKFIEEL